MQKKLDIVRDVSARLDGADIDYMLTGSMALNYYVQPSITRDNARELEVVVALRPAETARAVQLFSNDYDVSHETADTLTANTSCFKLFHNEGLISVDCIALKQTEYHLIEFSRRQRIRINDFETWMVSREDLILSKLRLLWAKDLHSELQLRDIKNLVSTRCDRAYIERWSWGLGTAGLWPEVAT